MTPREKMFEFQSHLYHLEDHGKYPRDLVESIIGCLDVSIDEPGANERHAENICRQLRFSQMQEAIELLLDYIVFKD